MRTAVHVADSEGLASLSMRAVAERLGFTTMSLYRYVPGKAELIDLMLDTAIGSPPAPGDPAGGWRSELERWARAFLEVLFQRPWVLEIVTSRPPGPNQLSWLEFAVRALSGSGLTARETLAVVLLVSGHVRGSAQVSFGFAQAEREGLTPAQRDSSWEGTLEWAVEDGRFPAITHVIASGAFEEYEGPGDDFEFGLQRVLDGIDSFIRGRAPERQSPELVEGQPRCAGASSRRRRSTNRPRSTK